MIELDYEKSISLNSLPDILQSIRDNKINYGINGSYCFVTDEDGELVFLKRIYGKEYYNDPECNVNEELWPLNENDGEKLWSFETYAGRGLEITELFLNFLNIEYQG